MTTKIYYIAIDGTRFTSKQQCLQYELDLKNTDGFFFIADGEKQEFNNEYLKELYISFLDDTYPDEYENEHEYLTLGFIEFMLNNYDFNTPYGALRSNEEKVFKKKCSYWLKQNYNMLKQLYKEYADGNE